MLWVKKERHELLQETGTMCGWHMHFISTIPSGPPCAGPWRNGATIPSGMAPAAMSRDRCHIARSRKAYLTDNHLHFVVRSAFCVLCLASCNRIAGLARQASKLPPQGTPFSWLSVPCLPKNVPSWEPVVSAGFQTRREHEAKEVQGSDNCASAPPPALSPALARTGALGLEMLHGSTGAGGLEGWKTDWGANGWMDGWMDGWVRDSSIFGVMVSIVCFKPALHSIASKRYPGC
jgi:hypothetical protein